MERTDVAERASSPPERFVPQLRSRIRNYSSRAFRIRDMEGDNKVTLSPGPECRPSHMCIKEGVDGDQVINALRLLEETGRRYDLPARTTVFFEGDPASSLQVVSQGRVKLSLVSHRGRSVIVRFALPGDLLGLSAILKHTTHEFVAETVEPRSLIRVQRSAFLELLQDSQDINALMTWALARDYQEMLRGIRRLGISNSVSGRLAQFLLNYIDAAGTDSSEMSFHMDLTRDELATMVNATRETVTRLMKQFERDELIACDGSSLVILNPARLHFLAG